MKCIQRDRDTQEDFRQDTGSLLSLTSQTQLICFKLPLPTRGSTTPRKWDFKEIGTSIIDVMLHKSSRP